jgi:hypothetical protein
MTGWVMKTEFVTETPLEHGNWSAVEFETFEEALVWWSAPDTKSALHRHMTLADPSGKVVAGRYVPVGERA